MPTQTTLSSSTSTEPPSPADGGSAPRFRVTTSWDDGHPLDSRLADLLARYEVHATFYVPRACPPREVMSERQLRDLSSSKLFEIGGHTLDHRVVRYMSADEGREQIGGCRKWIEDVTGTSPACFSPPLGQFRTRQLDWIRDAGFTAARTVELLSLDWPRHKAVEVLPTTVQAHPHRPTAYLRNAARRRAVGNFVRFAACAFEQDWVILARRMLDRAIRQDGVFHLWGHSWEIHEHRQWLHLEQVLRMIQEETPPEARVTNGALCRVAA